MTDATLTIIIASLIILLGLLILIARFKGGPTNNEEGNPAGRAARIEIVILGIFMIIGGLIALIREM
jgi:heme/copper-type cytochrome/quinol oxidase subunit 2